MIKAISSHHDRSIPGLRGTLNNVIFGVDTRAGRTFDVVLIAVIALSVLTVVLESVTAFRIAFSQVFLLLEWTFTILFTIEYIARLYCAPSARRYALSFFGIVDLVGTMPTYLSIIIPGAQFSLGVRLIRILRVFRVLRLAQFIGEAEVLTRAIQASRHKIEIFIFSVLTLVVILGSLMYLPELVPASRNWFRNWFGIGSTGIGSSLPRRRNAFS